MKRLAIVVTALTSRMNTRRYLLFGLNVAMIALLESGHHYSSSTQTHTQAVLFGVLALPMLTRSPTLAMPRRPDSTWRDARHRMDAWETAARDWNAARVDSSGVSSDYARGRLEGVKLSWRRADDALRSALEDCLSIR
jgi:hypothetical protein